MEHLVTNPLNYFFGLLFLLLAVVLFVRVKWYWHLPMLATVAFMFFILTPMGANIAVGWVTPNDMSTENCNPPLAVVLVEDLARPSTHSRDFGAMSRTTLARGHAAVEWLREDPNRTLVVSGEQENGAATVVYNYVLMNGIAPQRLVYDPSTPSYYDSAVSLADSLQGKEIALIVSHINIARAQLTFEKQGFSVCPHISDYHHLNGHPLLMVLPSAESISVANAVAWELVGMVWYWWTDRI